MLSTNRKLLRGSIFHILNYQKMDVQYIKDDKGQVAYAIVPIDIWEGTLSQINEPVVTYGSKREARKPFNPDDFLGIMSYPIEFLDAEIKKMRVEWDRNI